jgi:hypothetical protein
MFFSPAKKAVAQGQKGFIFVCSNSHICTYLSFSLFFFLFGAITGGTSLEETYNEPHEKRARLPTKKAQFSACVT